MTVDEIMESIISLAENDQSIDEDTMLKWIKQAINRINIAVKANFPSSLVGSDEPAFDARWHEALVLFGVAKYRASDSAYSDAQFFMQDFETMLQEMQRDMEIPPSCKIDYNYQQIVVTDATVIVYNLSIPSGSYYDDITVYINDSELTYTTDYSIDQRNRQITIIKSLTVNDKITVKFENNSVLNSPPYGWWENSGW